MFGKALRVEAVSEFCMRTRADKLMHLTLCFLLGSPEVYANELKKHDWSLITKIYKYHGMWYFIRDDVEECGGGVQFMTVKLKEFCLFSGLDEKYIIPLWNKVEVMEEKNGG
ncbi:MAG: hypothetical protein WC998_00700 [Candidatus Paceibacterota bacterium]|jgi:hypothetical protein